MKIEESKHLKDYIELRKSGASLRDLEKKSKEWGEPMSHTHFARYFRKNPTGESREHGLGKEELDMITENIEIIQEKIRDNPTPSELSQLLKQQQKLIELKEANTPEESEEEEESHKMEEVLMELVEEGEIPKPASIYLLLATEYDVGERNEGNYDRTVENTERIWSEIIKGEYAEDSRRDLMTSSLKKAIKHGYDPREILENNEDAETQ